jgi:hypothetical protein
LKNNLVKVLVVEPIERRSAEIAGVLRKKSSAFEVITTDSSETALAIIKASHEPFNLLILGSNPAHGLDTLLDSQEKTPPIVIASQNLAELQVEKYLP